MAASITRLGLEYTHDQAVRRAHTTKRGEKMTYEKFEQELVEMGLIEIPQQPTAQEILNEIQ